jgi:hypothetical protein
MKVIGIRVLGVQQSDDKLFPVGLPSGQNYGVCLMGVIDEGFPKENGCVLDQTNTINRDKFAGGYV